MTEPRDRLTQLEQLLRDPMLERIAPEPRQLVSLIDGLRLSGHEQQADDLESVSRIAQAQLEIMTCPILAVLGELNTGKSSVVASFLSETGRARVPRGIPDKYGTHRFVYWVPSSWLRSDDTKKAFFVLLATVHGDQREYLDADPQAAAEQYRSGRNHPEKMKIPLIADDPALDQIGAALLDCPDVQTGDWRMGFIESAAGLCSAFLLVWERKHVRDGLLTKFLVRIRKRMATVPLYLLINLIRPSLEQPTEARKDPDLVAALDQFQIRSDACYGAFDFDIEARDGKPGCRDLTPPALVTQFDAGHRFPQFFSLATTEAANEPAAVDAGRFLSSLPELLDAAEMQKQQLASHIHELRGLIRDAGDMLLKWKDDCNLRTAEIHRGLLELCANEFRSAEGEPLQVPDRQFTEALAESFLRTAPWYLTPGLLFRDKAKWLKDELDDAARKAKGFVQKVLEELRLRKPADADSSKAHRIEPDRLAHSMFSLRWHPAEVREKRLKEAWSEVVRNFSNHPLSVDKDKLDAMTRNFWNGLQYWQKIQMGFRGLIGVLGTVLAFAGVVAAAVDGGATLVAASGMLATAIHGQVALGVAIVGASGAAFSLFMSGLLYENTLPALAHLFHFACDAFGVPRRIEKQTCSVSFGKLNGKKSFPLPEVPTPHKSVACKLGTLGLWKVTSRVEDMKKVLDDG